MRSRNLLNIRSAGLMIMVFMGVLAWLLFTSRITLGPKSMYSGWPVWATEEQVHSGVLLADGKTVALANTYHGLIYFVDLRTGRFLNAFATPYKGVGPLLAPPDGRELVMLCGGHLVFFDLQHSCSILADMDLSETTPTTIVLPQAIALMPDGVTIAVLERKARGGLRGHSSTGRGQVTFIDSRVQRIDRKIEIPESSTASFAISPDGTRMLLGEGSGTGVPGTTVLLDLRTDNTIAVLHHSAPAGGGNKFTEDSKFAYVFYIAGMRRDGPAKDTWDVFDAKTGEFVRTISRDTASGIIGDDAGNTVAELPEFCEKFRSEEMYIVNVQSSDGTRSVRGGGGSLTVSNPKLPDQPSVVLTFFAGPSGVPSASDVAWFRSLRLRTGHKTYTFWDGSPSGLNSVEWNGGTGHPSPTRWQINNQRRPEYIDQYLDGVRPPIPP